MIENRIMKKTLAKETNEKKIETKGKMGERETKGKMGKTETKGKIGEKETKIES